MYPKASTDFTALFPKGRAPFQSGTQTDRVSAVKTLAGAIVSVIVNFLLIPRWGALGSAWAAAVSYLCSAVLSNLVVAPHAFRMQIRALVPFFHGRF